MQTKGTAWNGMSKFVFLSHCTFRVGKREIRGKSYFHLWNCSNWLIKSTLKLKSTHLLHVAGCDQKKN